MTKRDKKHIPKKQAGMQQSPEPSTRSRTIQRLWNVVGGLSVLLNFWLAYLALRPNVAVDYASNILPRNEIALPVRVTNNGLLPIRVVQYTFIDDLRTTRGGVVSGNKTDLSASDHVSPHSSVERVYDIINIGDSPSSGYIRVTVYYRSWIIPVTMEVYSSFTPYKNKDGTIRWLTRPGT